MSKKAKRRAARAYVLRCVVALLESAFGGDAWLYEDDEPDEITVALRVEALRNLIGELDRRRRKTHARG